MYALLLTLALFQANPKMDCDEICKKATHNCMRSCKRKPPTGKSQCVRMCDDMVAICQEKCKETTGKMAGKIPNSKPTGNHSEEDHP